MRLLALSLLSLVLHSPAAAESSTETVRLALGYLAWALGSEDPEVRSLSARAWGELGNRSAKKLLKRALSDEDPYVRIEASYSLHRIGEEGGLESLADMVLASSSVVLGISTAPTRASSPDLDLREVTFHKIRVRAIERLADIGGEQVVEVLELSMEDPAESVRDATAVALARLGFNELDAVFLEALKDEKDSVRAAAARAIGRLGRPIGLRQLAWATTDYSPLVRAEAYRALGETRGFKLVGLLARGLKDDEILVRIAAVEGLGRIRTDLSRNILFEVAKDTGSPILALKASLQLARRGEKIALAIPDRALVSRDPDLVVEAVEILRSVPDESSTERLRSVLYGEYEPRARVLAAWGLVHRLARGRGRRP